MMMMMAPINVMRFLNICQIMEFCHAIKGKRMLELDGLKKGNFLRNLPVSSGTKK